MRFVYDEGEALQITNGFISLTKRTSGIFSLNTENTRSGNFYSLKLKRFST